MPQPTLIDIRKPDTLEQAKARLILFDTFPSLEEEIDEMHGTSCLELIKSIKELVRKES